MKRTGPNPSLCYVISFGFGICRVAPLAHILRTFHPITVLSALNAPPLPPHFPSLCLSPALHFPPGSINQSVAHSIPPMGALCCRPQVGTLAPLVYSVLTFPSSKVIDFDADVNLFHFLLLRCVGKGAFGKVHISEGCPHHPSQSNDPPRFASFNISRHATCTPSNTSTKPSACE